MKVHVNGSWLQYYCPGCKHAHTVNVGGDLDYKGPQWSWNGEFDKLDLQPSIRVYHGAQPEDGIEERTLCHHFVHGGLINFLDDSSGHQLRGLHPLPHFPEGYGLGDFRCPAPPQENTP